MMMDLLYELTKSKIITGLRCPKKLWFDINEKVELGLPLDKNMIVYTSGLGGNFRAGLPIGKINQDLDELGVEFFSDLSQLSYVKIQSIESLRE